MFILVHLDNNSNIFTLFGRLILILSFYLGISNLFIPLKFMISQFITNFNYYHNIFLSLILLIISEIISTQISDLYSYISFFGLSFGSILVISFPLLLASKIKYDQQFINKILNGVIIIVSISLIVIGFLMISLN